MNINEGIPHEQGADVRRIGKYVSVICRALRKLKFNDLANVKEEIIFKNEIGRLRDIQIHPNNGKIYFLSEDSLWLMEKN